MSHNSLPDPSSHRITADDAEVAADAADAADAARKAHNGDHDHGDDDPGDVARRGLRLAVVVLAIVAVLIATDLVLDERSGADAPHLAVEGLLMLVSAGGAGWLWLTLRRTRRSVVALERDVDAARADASRWRAEAREALEGLGVSLARQFDRWHLTPAERQVALLLLKGLSHREAAQVRSTSERTVRQQARAVYRKAGLSGRSELSAFFLEDLLLPPSATHDPHPPDNSS